MDLLRLPKRYQNLLFLTPKMYNKHNHPFYMCPSFQGTANEGAVIIADEY